MQSFAIAGKKDRKADEEQDLEAIMNETRPEKGDGGEQSEQSEGVQVTTLLQGYRFGFIPDVTYKAGNTVLSHAQMLLDMYTS